MSNITVNYCLGGVEISKIEVPRNIRVGDFIARLSTKSKTTLHGVFIDGRKLDHNDLLRNHIRCPSDVFIVADRADMTPDDFFSIDRSEQISDKAALISDSMHVKHHKDSTTTSTMLKKPFTIFTTLTERSFTKGDKLTISTTKDDLEAIKKSIKQMIRGWALSDLPDNFELHIFLPGGIPFLDGFISDYVSCGVDITKDILNVIVTRPLKAGLLERPIDSPCNCTGDMKDLLSPLFDSSQAGLTQIACLLGYFYYGGVNAEKLLLILAKATRFSPLLVNLYRLLEHSPLIGLNIIAITAPLFIFFKPLLSEDITSREVFENTLNIISYISLLPDYEFLKLYSFDFEPGNDDDEYNQYQSYCAQFCQIQTHQIVWEEETNPNRTSFAGYDIEQPDPEDLENILESVVAFAPVSPLSLHFIYYPTFIKTDQEKQIMLFLHEVPGKKDTIRYIDPLKGRKETITIENLARSLHTTEETNVLELIDHHIVQQLIVICFDQSVSMKWKLSGGNPKAERGELSRLQIATRFLESFVQQSHKLRISSIYGLITFGSSVNIEQGMTPISNDFLKKLGTIKAVGKTLLWDAIEQARTTLNHVSESSDDEFSKYTNAQKRIIIITDGEDNKSDTNAVDLANNLIRDDIIVDTVLVSLRETNNDCCALTKLTGGLCFRPDSIENGLSIFEQEAFTNIKTRHLYPPNAPNVTEDTIRRLSESITNYDTQAENQEILNANQPVSLATPFNVIYESAKSPGETLRKNRALHELNLIGHHKTSKFLVLSYHSGPDNWRIFLKGAAGTAFQDKYLNLHMNLPSKYPGTPPIFRFLTKPFHPNVSEEGKVIFSLADQQYSSKVHIIEILDGIYNLMANPEVETAVNREALNLYTDDHDAYLARQRREDKSVNDFNIFLRGIKVYKKIPKARTPPDIDIYDQISMTRVANAAPLDEPDLGLNATATRIHRGKKILSEEEEDNNEPADITTSYIRPRRMKVIADDSDDPEVPTDPEPAHAPEDLTVSRLPKSGRSKVLTSSSDDDSDVPNDLLVSSHPAKHIKPKRISDDYSEDEIAPPPPDKEPELTVSSRFIASRYITSSDSDDDMHERILET